MAGGLRAGMTFSPDTVADSAAAREVSDRIAHETVLHGPAATHSETAVETGG